MLGNVRTSPGYCQQLGSTLHNHFITTIFALFSQTGATTDQEAPVYCILSIVVSWNTGCSHHIQGPGGQG